MGRPGKPWFRSSRNRWYAKIGGELMDLGDSKREADANFARLTAEVVKAVRAEIAPPAPTGSACRPGTVAELVPAFVRAADVERATRADYADRLRWLVRHFGGTAVAALDPEAVEAAARAEPWKANTRRQTLAVAQKFARWCRRADFRPRLPPVESRGDEAVLTPAEYARLLAAADGDFRQLVRFVRHAGCRQGEACRLTAELVAGAGGVVVLRRHKTAKRTGKPRLLFLNATARRVLAEQAARYASGPLFRGGRGARITSRRAGVLFAEAAARAGLGGGKTFNSLRHTFATDALDRGLSDSDVATLLGHADTTMLHRHYAHKTANARRLGEQVERLDGAA